MPLAADQRQLAEVAALLVFSGDAAICRAACGSRSGCIARDRETSGQRAITIAAETQKLGVAQTITVLRRSPEQSRQRAS